MSRLLKAFLLDRGGNTAVEYALIIVLVSLGLMAIFEQIGNEVSDFFIEVGNSITDPDIVIN